MQEALDSIPRMGGARGPESKIILGYKQFEGTLSYMRPYFKRKKKKLYCIRAAEARFM